MELLSSEQIDKIKDGFKLQKVIMKDADTQELYWESDQSYIHNKQEIQTVDVTINEKILLSKAANRVIRFSSEELLKDLWLVQTAYLGDKMIEKFRFKFGFVMPESTNEWSSVQLNDKPENLIPKEIQSGNLIVHIQMVEQNTPIFEVKLRLFYT